MEYEICTSLIFFDRVNLKFYYAFYDSNKTMSQEDFDKLTLEDLLNSDTIKYKEYDMTKFYTSEYYDTKEDFIEINGNDKNGMVLFRVSESLNYVIFSNNSNKYTSIKNYFTYSGAEIGMTKSEVKKTIWGEPDKINKREYKNYTYEQWVYKKYGYIYFENDKVTSISTSK